MAAKNLFHHETMFRHVTSAFRPVDDISVLVNSCVTHPPQRLTDRIIHSSVLSESIIMIGAVASSDQNLVAVLDSAWLGWLGLRPTFSHYLSNGLMTPFSSRRLWA